MPAEKQYLKLDKKTRQQIKKALFELEKEEYPLFHRYVRPLTGAIEGDYRLRSGDWRVLFTPDKEKRSFMYTPFFPGEMSINAGQMRLCSRA